MINSSIHKKDHGKRFDASWQANQTHHRLLIKKKQNIDYIIFKQRKRNSHIDCTISILNFVLDNSLLMQVNFAK